MTSILTFDRDPGQRALAAWEVDCKRRMALKFPLIGFDADVWLIRTLYHTKQPDWRFTKSLADFESRDPSFSIALRCVIAEAVIAGEPKTIHMVGSAFRLLKNTTAESIFELSVSELRMIERSMPEKAKARSASTAHGNLYRLKLSIDLLTKKGVIPPLGFHISPEVKAALTAQINNAERKSKTAKLDILDHQIEAFNDAVEGLVNNDSRLVAGDRTAIAAGLILMMAPSRINEPLCCSIDDHLTVEDYVSKPGSEDKNRMNQAHQMLILTMKGSKGAQWSPKPALSFMIDAFHYARDVILQHSRNSRILVEWYEQHPDTLYLPSELEYLRSKDLDAVDLAKIVLLREESPETPITGVEAGNYMRALDGHAHWVTVDDGRTRKRVVPFEDAERFLLEKVHDAMATCRRVTPNNPYLGTLSKMLFLFDGERAPYLPQAFNYQHLHKRLKLAKSLRAERPDKKNLFERLNITMPVDGKMVSAYIDSHDFRRWLTTQAQIHGDRLSDVLINKWTNRKSLRQLSAYDYRKSEELAEACAMPESAELSDLSDGLTKLKDTEEVVGLKTQMVVVSDAHVKMTSMKDIRQAVEDRPVARVSSQILVIYPDWFGACVHQHYETPCRRYNSCLPCNNHLTIKGDEPSNQRVRERKEDLFNSILRQLEDLVIVHNRGIADEPDSLEAHIMALTTKGLDLSEMTERLIDDFHVLRSRIKDKRLAAKLEEAFVAKETVRYLDAPSIEDGAIIMYHNPACHEAPTQERVISVYRSREERERATRELMAEYLDFAAKAEPIDHAKYAALLAEHRNNESAEESEAA